MENEKTKEIRYFSMFSGVGGFELGLQGNRSSQSECGGSEESILPRGSESSSKTFKCIGVSEIDKYASELLAKKFPAVKNWGDATKINPAELPDFDMLCGGFPCQSFSIAGKRRGFEDTRGTLFFDVARIIKVKRPKIVFLENVKGLLNHNEGQTFRKIIQTISELGYNVQWMVLNSKFFGVPQNRERVFIIGSLRGTSRPEILPFEETDTTTNRCKEGDGKETSTRQCLQSIGSESKSTGRNTRFYTSFNESSRIRRLTPIECERLQGFPEGWTEGFSDTQRYKMMGNAVTINVVKAIGEKLTPSTGLVSLKQNKKFVGIELNSEYIKIAETRIKTFLKPQPVNKVKSKKAIKPKKVAKQKTLW